MNRGKGEVEGALAKRLRAALQSEAAVPPLSGDLPELRAQASISAAVLIAITDRPEPGVVLTVRREDMRTHAGQVAFPGGRIDAGEDPISAAIREAHEERETTLGTAMFFVGFLAFLVIGMTLD